MIDVNPQVKKNADLHRVEKRVKNLQHNFDIETSKDPYFQLMLEIQLGSFQVPY